MTASIGQYYRSEQLTSVVVQSAANVAGIYYNGAGNTGTGSTLTANSNSTLTVDGVIVTLGERVYLAAQTDPTQNGIYIVSNPGSSSSKWVLTRSDDLHSANQIRAGMFFTVQSGTVNIGNAVVIVAPVPSVVGIDEIVFSDLTQVPSGTYLTAANNLNDVDDPVISLLNLGGQPFSNILADRTASYGGGSNQNTFSVPGLTNSSIVIASIFNRTNNVAITEVQPSTDGLGITFTADPGAGTVIAYIAFIEAQ